MIVDWPEIIIPKAESVPRLERNVASGGGSLTGAERIVITSAGRWRWSARIGIRTVTQLRAWRGFIAITQGRGNIIRVPFIDTTSDLATVNGERAARAAVAAGVTFSEDAVTWDDGSLWTDTVMPGTVAQDRAAGVSNIRLRFSAGLVCEPGDFFSTGNRLYQARGVTLVSGNTYDVDIMPPLRDAIYQDGEVSFDRLTCLMRFENEDQLDLDLDPAFMGDLSLSFVEAFS